MKNKFNFLTISKTDFLSRKDLLRQIKDGEVSGVIVKEFFSKPEVETLVNSYLSNDLKRSQLPLNQGVTYPTVFAHVQKETGNTEPGISNYFLACEHYKADFKNRFGVDAPHYIQSAFEATSGGRPVRLPAGVTAKGIYPFSTFRELNPGTGEMTLHCGLYFYYMFPEFYKHLHSIVADNNQLSFFSLLRKPQFGGELTIFDITRKDAVKKIDDLQLESLTGEVLHIEQNVENFKLKIEEGDFLIFDGGTIWHRVELVQGETHRITFGGFLGFTNDNQEIYYWS
jgi:hypothetical protein